MSKWGKIGRDSYLAGKGKDTLTKKALKALLKAAAKKRK